MNRLTKEIGLVLISSSLSLHGCGGRPQPRGFEFANEKQRQLNASGDFSGEGDFGDETVATGSGTPGSDVRPGTAGTSHSYHSPVHHSGHVPIFVPLGGPSRSVPRPATSSGFRAGPAASPAPHATGGSRAGSSSVGASARGGFGGTGHGVSS